MFDNIDYQKKHYQNNKETYRIKNAARKQRNREYVANYLRSHPCVDCGESDIIVLEFDHIDPSTKNGMVSDAYKNGWSIKRINKEIAKCDVVCANCHKRRTAKQRNSYRYQAP